VGGRDARTGADLTWIDFGKKYPDPLPGLVTAVQEAVGSPW
jgi:hypothetical protein